MRLFSNRSQMTSKCRKNKEVAHEPQAVIFTTFWRPLWSITEQTQGNMESICFLYNNWDSTRAVIGRCLLSIRGQMHERRHCVAWPARVIKVHSSQSSGKDFQNSGPKQSEKYSLLVEDFSEKETAEYQSQWEAFNSAKHARSLPGKKLSKAAWKLCCRKVCGRRGKSTNADEWQRLNTFSCSLLSRITLQMK